MKWAAAWGVIAVLVTGPAHALSCLRPDIAMDFQRAQASEQVYVVVKGMLTFDIRKLPRAKDDDPNDTPADTYIPARFEGQSLSPNGFDRAFRTPVTLNVTCFGPWCGGASSGIEYIAFAEKTDDGYLLEANACGGFMWPNPTQELVERVTLCMAGGPCEVEPN